MYHREHDRHFAHATSKKLVVNAKSDGTRKRNMHSRVEPKIAQHSNTSGELDNTHSARPQRREYRTEPASIERTEPHGSTSERSSFFAPGPADPRWQEIISRTPELAPAIEPTFRIMVNGLAFDMGDSRAPRLKCVGNGVVALCAATALVVLAQRSGIFELIKEKAF